ncbi:MAG: asparaginase domain-containing protein [Campylobacterota bacterium]
MLILNSGGTFNKRYSDVDGVLEVPYDSMAVVKILDSVKSKYDLAGVIFKDSLEMTLEDRKMLTNIIMESKDSSFLIIHGTDTMNETAQFLDEIFDDRKIVITGAMKPYEIDKSEASFNLGMSMGFLKAKPKNGVYICMNGYVKSWNKLTKNRQKGQFEVVK